MAICGDRFDNMWLGTLGGGLNKLDKYGTITRYRHNKENKKNSLNSDNIYTIFEDQKEDLWIGTSRGFNLFDRKTEGFIHFESKALPQLSKTPVMDIFECSNGILWIGTYGTGVYQFNRKSGHFRHYESKPGEFVSLSSNYIQDIYEDNTGILWVGTDSGLNKFDKKKQKFGSTELRDNNPNSLSSRNVWAICKDSSNGLWIGTEGGVDYLDRKQNRCSRFKRMGGQNFDNKRITALCEGKDKKMWIGTLKNGVCRYDPITGTSKAYIHTKSDPGTISPGRIQRIYQDSTDTLWVGTTYGLDRYLPEKDSFRHYNCTPGNRENADNNNIITIFEDGKGVLWLGTKGGLNKFHRETETFSHWKRETDNPESLSNNDVSAIWEDAKEILWIGTIGGGLNKFDRQKGTFKHYLEKDGLPTGSIYSILGDMEGNLWMSTNKGISKFDPAVETFKNYDARDGLQSNEFHFGACFKSEDGEMFFGGINGFNAFYPHKIKDNPNVPPIVITDFLIKNEPVKIGPKSPLKQAITETKEIVLSHSHYFFSFDFAALDFSIPAKNKYAYKMVPFDKDWIYRDADKRFVTYTNLDPGEYVFRVIGSNNDGVWNEEGASIKIIIVPPYWETWWFRLLLLVAFAVLSYTIINFVKTYITLAGFWKREKYIGKFKLIEKIGAGGMGTIYKAQNTTERSETVAIKILREELFEHKDYRKRFKQEAAIIDQLDHPNIVRVIERGQHKQKLFIVMELLKGKTLADKILEEGKVNLKETVEIMLQVANALLKIHSKNIVHRDLKPENVMLIEKEGKPNFVKLLDFGLAKQQSQSRITQTGAVLGTINYMSPEQVSVGEFSSASDIYAMGAIFYETVTNHKLFSGETITDIMKQIIEKAPLDPIHLRPDLPVEINELIMLMLEKSIELRPTVEEVIQDLTNFQQANGSALPPNSLQDTRIVTD